MDPIIFLPSTKRTAFTPILILLVLLNLVWPASGPAWAATGDKTAGSTPKVTKSSKASSTGKVKAPREADLSYGWECVTKAVALVKAEAREECKPGKLANGGIDGMRLYIEELKLSSDFLKSIPEELEEDKAFDSLKEQYYLAAKTYPESFYGQKLTMSLIQGILYATGDKYTVFLSPEEYSLLQEAMSGGNFGGVGVVIMLDEKNDNTLTVSKVTANGPAEAAGLKANDCILAIDGKKTHGLSISQCSKLLRGEADTKVKLTIKRPEMKEAFNVLVTREIIHVSSVTSKMLEKNNHKIGYIYLSIFGESTNQEVEKAMQTLTAEGAQGYILDIRGNSGGYINAAIDVCSKFLPTGSRVVSTVERVRPENISYSHPNLKGRKPLVVLVDGGSASASEITAGAIKDHKRGLLIGEKTYGKGSVQKVYPMALPKGKTSALKITIAHYHTPLGYDIHEVGIQPDIIVTPTKEEIEAKTDVQLNKALETVEAEIVANKSSAPDPSDKISVKSLQEQKSYIKDALHGEQYTVLSRQLVKEGAHIYESVRIKTAGGQVVKYLFDMTAVLGQ